MKSNKIKLTISLLLLAVMFVSSLVLITNTRKPRADESKDNTEISTELTETTETTVDNSEDVSSETEDVSSEDEQTSEDTEDTTEEVTEDASSSEDTTEETVEDTEDGFTTEEEAEEVDAGPSASNGWWIGSGIDESTIKYLSNVSGDTVVKKILYKLNGRYEYSSSTGPDDCNLTWVCSTMGSYVMNKYHKLGSKMPISCQSKDIWKKLRALCESKQVYYVGSGGASSGTSHINGMTKKFEELVAEGTIRKGDILIWTYGSWEESGGVVTDNPPTTKHVAIVGETRKKGSLKYTMIYHAYSSDKDTCGTPMGNVLEGNIADDNSWTWDSSLDDYSKYSESEAEEMVADSVYEIENQDIEGDKVFAKGAYTHYYVYRVSGKNVLPADVNIYKCDNSTTVTTAEGVTTYGNKPLEGAIFQMNYYDTSVISTPVYTWSKMEDKTPTKIIYLKSDSNGKVQLRPGCIISKTCSCSIKNWATCSHDWSSTFSSMKDADTAYGGNYFYHDGTDLTKYTVGFPEGSLGVFEIQAPEGYALDDSAICYKYVYDSDGNLVKRSKKTEKVLPGAAAGTTEYVYKVNKKAGSFGVRKTASVDALNDNVLYSLAGAKFTLYKQEKYVIDGVQQTEDVTIGGTTFKFYVRQYIPAKDADGNNIVITTDENGDAVYEGTVDPGVYYIAETEAPTNFTKPQYSTSGDEGVQYKLQVNSNGDNTRLMFAKLEIESGKTAYPQRMSTYIGGTAANAKYAEIVAAGGTPENADFFDGPAGVSSRIWQKIAGKVYVSENPRSTTAGLFVRKVDKDTNQGLNGAIFRCSYYDKTSYSDTVGAVPKKIWYFESKDAIVDGVVTSGIVNFSSDFLRNDSEFQSDEWIDNTMYLGVYVIQEVKAPKGYKSDDNWRHVLEVRTATSADTFYGVTDGSEKPVEGYVYCYPLDPSVSLVATAAYKKDYVAPLVNYAVATNENSLGTVSVKKVSSNPAAITNNSCYSLADAKYYLCYSHNPGEIVMDHYGNPVILVTDENGDATWGKDPATGIITYAIPEGTYYAYEDPVGPKGHVSENFGKDMDNYVWHEVAVAPKGNTLIGNAPQVNEALGDPIEIQLSKQQSGEGKPVYLQGAQYAVRYYKNIQTTDVNQLTGLTPERTWYLLTDSNGQATFDAAHLDPSMANPEFYYNKNGEPEFPLGTVTIEETKAPTNFVRDTTVYCACIKDGGNGEVIIEGDSFVIATNERTHPNEPAFVKLNIKKASDDPTPLQGSTGDVDLGNAVFALYLRRDIVYAGNTFAVASKTATEDTPLTFADGTPIVDAYGNPVIAKAGELLPFAVLDPTNELGETSLEELRPAMNVDDYYVKELVAPKGYLKKNDVFEIDMRNPDITQNEKVIDVNYTVTDTPQKQPIHLMKYVRDEDSYGNESLKPYNDIHFKLYLISNLKNLENAKKIENADGSFTYDFRGYDFTDEVAEIVTEDGKDELVTGEGGEDGAADTMPLYYGEYVLVETVTPDELEPVDPMIISIPKYRYDAEGNVQFNKSGDPIIYTFRNADVLNQPVEKLLKINKTDEEGNLVLHNSATFTIWNVTDDEDQLIATNEFVKENGEKVIQYKQTETGFVPVDTFTTTEDGFLVLYDEFKYGTYAIVEEVAPVGYALAEPTIFRVRRDGIEFFVEDTWVLGTVYYDDIGREYWEVPVIDDDFDLRVAKVDEETGKYVTGAEFTVYKAVDETGKLALDANGDPIILECKDTNGKDVKAIWTSEEKFVEFNVIPAGWYVIRETKTPTGYATLDDVIIYLGDSNDVAPNGVRHVTGEDVIYYDFTEVDGGVEFGTNTEMDIDSVNVKVALPEKPITVEISKINSATEKELPGAVLSLFSLADGKETLVETWTSTDKPHVVKYLPVGEYKLFEDTAPLGFYAEPNTIKFTIEDTGAVQKQVMINHPIEVEFNKQSLNTGNSVSGATLALYRVSPGPWGADADNEDTEDAEDDSSTEEVTASSEEETSSETTEEASTVNDKIDTSETIVGAIDRDVEGLQLVERWVSDGNPHKIVGLYPGTYRLVEEVTPYGYTTSNCIDFEITDDKKPEPVMMYDEPVECRIQIYKSGETLADTKEVKCEYGKYTKFIWKDASLKGVQFDIFNEAGELVETIVTDEFGMAYSGVLPFGKYTVKERVPDGWVDDEIVYTIEFTWLQDMTEDKLTANLEVYNESCNTQINIYKTGEDAVLVDGQYEYPQYPLKGVLFGVYAKKDINNYNGELLVKKDTCVGYCVSDDNGVATLDEKLVKGKYYYKELKTAGPEYVIDDSNYSFELILENSKIDVFNVNEKDPVVNERVKSHIQVYKISNDKKLPLAGAEFDVFNSDDELVAHLVTGEDGYAETEELPYGDYYLVETKAPEGYQRVDTEFDANIVIYDEITKVTIENSKTPKLGTFTIVSIIIMSLVVAVFGTGIVVSVTHRRRHNK